MNFSSPDQSDKQFQIAPMIDVVFILLIFFIATYVAAQDEKLLDITLPESPSAKQAARSQQEIVVNLNAAGEIFIRNRRFSHKDLERRLAQLMEFSTAAARAGGGPADPGVIIRAHAECAHKHVVAVMDVCAREQVGIRRVFFSAVSNKTAETEDAD